VGGVPDVSSVHDRVTSLDAGRSQEATARQRQPRFVGTRRAFTLDPTLPPVDQPFPSTNWSEPTFGVVLLAREKRLFLGDD